MSNKLNDVVITSALRTPIGTYKGSLKSLTADKLGTGSIKEALHKSKLKAETFIREINCKYAILRFGGIYGKNGPSHLGINKFITDAFANKKIHFYGNPQTLRNYIFVNDAARAIVNCMKHKVIGAFYVGGQIQTFEKMLNKIVKIINKNKKVNFIDNNQPRSDQLIENDEIIKPISFKKSLEIMRLE